MRHRSRTVCTRTKQDQQDALEAAQKAIDEAQVMLINIRKRCQSAGIIFII